MRFRHRLQIALLLPLLAAVVASGVLTYVAFNRLNAGLVQSRLSFILANLRTSVESSLGLGLQLGQVPGAQDMIERARAGSKQIRAIDIFDRSGRSLFSTDRGVIGGSVPAAWLRSAHSVSTGSVWHVASHGDVVFGLNIDNNLGQIVGSAAVTVPATAWQRRSALMARFIELLGVVAVAIVLAGTLIGGWWLSRRSERPLAEATRLLADDSAPVIATTGMSELIGAARSRAAAARQAVADAANRLAALVDGD